VRKRSVSHDTVENWKIKPVWHALPVRICLSIPLSKSVGTLSKYFDIVVPILLFHWPLYTKKNVLGCLKSR
jgi:hypothetical protein